MNRNYGNNNYQNNYKDGYNRKPKSDVYVKKQ